MQTLMERLISRDAPRTEADVQSDVRLLLLSPEFHLEDGDLQLVHLESQLGDRRRIDVEVGSAVIEVKRDLRKGKVRIEAVSQLTGYVQKRGDQTGRRYVGILTDGVEWRCYHLVGSNLTEVSEHTAVIGSLDRLIAWLEGVLATAKEVSPTANEIAARLGAASSAHALDRATLAALYKLNADRPTVKTKRNLWSRLLTSAFGNQFKDADDLFIEHTLLVNSAEIIAHSVLGLDVDAINPNSLLAGSKFDESGIYGVVEADFFDWVLEVDGGQQFIRTLARRLGRFAWNEVNQDVLKILYQSVISAATRKKLGEYYTPDWLAEAIVDEAIADPLNQRALDPSCGSGTFLFHSVRKYIAAAETKNVPLAEMLDGLTSHVYGMDLHPVAVTLARVTYLLAIGKERLLDPKRGTVHIPVFLGDSLQWREQQLDLWTAGNLVIHADDRRELFAAELRFPDALLEDAPRFDQLVKEMANRASARKPKTAVPSLLPMFQRLAIPEGLRAELNATFKTMCRLHDEERDHIWGYYVRNLARPLWLAREANRVDVLIGNPPWLAFRHMPRDMQGTFKDMSEARRLWAGAEAATHQDLSALFVVRATQLYLKKGGRLAMVMSNAAVDRDAYGGFRTGYYPDKAARVSLKFEPSWDLRRIRPHFFPRGSSVVFARREETAGEMPLNADIWSGRLRRGNMTWKEAKPKLTREAGKVTHTNKKMRSPYARAFTQGAILSPRFLFIVTQKGSSPLGLQKGMVAVASHRSAYEAVPWKNLPDVAGVVETEFVRPIFSGENLLPFRMTNPLHGVIPCVIDHVLTDRAELEYYSGLDQWWTAAEALWEKHRSTERLSLMQQLNYQQKLSKQLPVQPLRVVYNTSGMHVFGAKVTDRRTLISSALYWAAVNGHEEADFLCTVLNSSVTSVLLKPFMPYGKDERHVHKHIWQLPVPMFDKADATHRKVVELGTVLAKVAADFPVDPDVQFSTTRGLMRASMELTPEGKELGKIVKKMLSAE